MNNLRQFLQQQQLTQASIARSLGVSPTAISQYLRGTYAKAGGDAVALEAKISTYMANYQAQGSQQTQAELYETSDLIMVHSICDEIAIHQDMGVIYGKAGTGKTVAIKAFVTKHPEAVLIETTPMMSVKELLAEILRGLGQRSIYGSASSMIKQIVRLFNNSQRILLIDEAENLTTKSLEAIRRIHDFSQVPTVLVGTYALLQNLKGRQGELLQLYSRISNKWEMQGLNDKDRQGLFGELAQAIKRYTTDIRRSVNIYQKAKRYARLDKVQLNNNHITMAIHAVILN